jgi:thiamine biosynthesis lipoprotein
MGTIFRIQVFAMDEQVARLAAESAFAKAHRMDFLLSDYRQDSELMELFRKPVGVDYPVAREITEVLSRSLQIHRLSNGAFDVTIGQLTREWRRAARTGRLPSERRLGKALRSRGMECLRLRKDEGTLSFEKSGLLIDLGGIAKGYTADRMLEVLQNRGCPVAVVSAGGDLRVGAAPPGEPGWNIIVRPFGADTEDSQAVRIMVAECGVSTSGSVNQFVEINGRRYSHIVDPRIGLGIAPGLACTVVSSSGQLSDPLATACCVLGIDRGRSLVEAMGADVLFAVVDDAVGGSERGNVRFESSVDFPRFFGERDEKTATDTMRREVRGVRAQ